MTMAMPLDIQEVLARMEDAFDFIIATITIVTFISTFLVYTLALLKPIRPLTLDCTEKEQVVSFTFVYIYIIYIYKIYLLFIAYVTITDLQRYLHYESILKIVCTTGSYPPTKITWYKDNDPLNMTNVTMTTTIINQLSSSYDITLLVEDVPDNLIGTYSITVGNDLQTTNRTLSPPIRG